ncbi:MAG: hypothetical protein E7435_06120 [Ruminococcaceae bacterium]|nr:hypothetical protein [Oscillospiraceae bacterium]
MKSVLCYGDSNTWGCVPGVLSRHPAHVRWTGVMADALGEEYHIIEDGINGRTTVWDDPANQCRNGLACLGYSLYRAKPLDLVVLMLGTNDMHYTDAQGYSEGLRMLAKRILEANEKFPGTSKVFLEQPKLLLVSPISAIKDRFAPYTQKVAEELGVPWLNAADFAEPSPADGCHMDEKNHKALGLAIAQKVKEILE